MNFTQLSVRTRIYAGFGLLILIAMGVALFGISRVSQIGTQLNKLDAVTDSVGRVQQILLQLETIRRTALRYTIDSDAASLKTAQDAMTFVADQLRNGSNLTPSEERRRTYTTLVGAIQNYRGLIDRLVSLQTQLTEERAKLFTGGDALTAATDRLITGVKAADDSEATEAAMNVERAVLLVRVANWRFLATKDPTGPATFKANLSKAEDTIVRLDHVASDTTRADLQPVKAALAAYGESFDSVASNLVSSADLFDKELRPRIQAMQNDLTSTSGALTASFASIQQESAGTIANADLLQAILTGLSLVLGITLALLIGGGIAKPIRAMTAIMSRLANGDTSFVIPALDGTDEIGDMARAVEVFKANLIRADSLSAEQAAERGRKETRQGAVGNHIETFDHSVRGLLTTLITASTELRATAQSMSETADQTNRQAGAVTIAAEQASANVQTMAAATEEMASSGAEIARQVGRSTTIAARAVEAARSTNRQVQGLADTAQKIEAVVAIINGIASQTNLLALNATIEAARAGDAGKGFAVVASEVKALASQTGRATGEIGAQIQAIQSATQAAVEAIKDIGATIDEMNEISTAIAAATEEQGATTDEMARNTQQAARGTQEVSATISGVSQGAQATGSAAGQVLSAANDLGVKAETLRTEVDNFLNKIRAV